LAAIAERWPLSAHLDDAFLHNWNESRLPTDNVAT
jgi:hypothetical protein